MLNGRNSVPFCGAMNSIFQLYHGMFAECRANAKGMQVPVMVIIIRAHLRNLDHRTRREATLRSKMRHLTIDLSLVPLLFGVKEDTSVIQYLKRG